MNHILALSEFVSLDWAIDELWVKNALKVFAGQKSEIPPRSPSSDIAFLVQGADKPNGTRYTYITGNKAVIDVYGAIIPRANLMSEYSGGTSCQMLLKDIAFLKTQSSFIKEALFCFHTPGGDVTGISDTGRAIKELSKAMQVNAYVSGMACSAGYWLASCCDKIYANENASVGSIGVMAVYLDDSKRLEMLGLEEVEFISSQSPLKNADPKSKKGAEQIQRRVNAQAQVFVETVAKNRQVSVEKVLNEFGQGGVFAGKDLIQARNVGMIDAIASFNEALASIDPQVLMNEETTFDNAQVLAETNGEKVEKSTKLQKTAVNAETIKGENTMSQEAEGFFQTMKNFFAKNDNQEGQNLIVPSRVSADEEKLKAEENKRIQAEQEAAELRRQLTENEKAKTALEEEKLEAVLKETAKNWYGGFDAHAIVLKELAAQGVDSIAFKAYVETQNAQAKLIEASSLFTDTGSHKGAQEKTALEELTEKANQIVLAKNIPFANAMTEVALAEPELYARYRKGE